MAFNWYRRLKLGFDLTSSRYYLSKIIAPKPPLSITNQFRSTFNNNNNQQSLIRVTRVPSSLLKSSHFGSSYGYRCYHTAQQLTGNRKDYDGYFTPVCLILALHFGIFIIYFGHVETVPYTKRLQCLLMPSDMERKVGVSRFEGIKDRYKGKVLAEMHPESVRVRKIWNDVVEALMKNDRVYACCCLEIGLMKGKFYQRCIQGVKLPGFMELLLGSKGLEWEVLVVKDDRAYACCLPGGKFVVFTGLLDRFNTDEEIAAIIAREVSHVVARHVAEKFTNKYYWHLFVPLLTVATFEGNYANSSLDLPFSPRMEIEADYIGLMLMAYAGYDPQVAPKVLEKLGRASGDLAFRSYCSIHWMGNTRSKSLCEASVMQEAISLYEEAKACRPVEVDT